MKNNVRFYFKSGARSASFGTDKGTALLEELASALQSEAPIFSIALMQEPLKGPMLLLKKDEVTGASLTPMPKKKKKKKKRPAPSLSPGDASIPQTAPTEEG